MTISSHWGQKNMRQAATLIATQEEQLVYVLTAKLNKPQDEKINVSQYFKKKSKNTKEKTDKIFQRGNKELVHRYLSSARHDT